MKSSDLCCDHGAGCAQLFEFTQITTVRRIYQHDPLPLCHIPQHGEEVGGGRISAFATPSA